MKNRKLLLGLVMILVFSLLLTACGEKDKPEEKPAEVTENVEQTDGEETEEVVELSEWDGTWDSFEAYLDEDEIQGAFDELAEREGKTAEEAKADYVEKLHADFKGLKVEGDKVTFYDDLVSKDGKEIESVEYEFVKIHKVMHGNYELEWDVFQATTDGAKHPVLLMMPVHGEEALTHFHMRYGEDEQALLDMEDWYPTFIKPDSTIEQIYDEIAE